MGSASEEAQEPTVTVLIPMRNEVASIERCLSAVIDQDIDDGTYEIIVIDGDSTDGSADTARDLLRAWRPHGWRIVHNPGATTPSNLHRGLEAARGAVICRVDSRSIIPPQYLRRCREVLEVRSDIAVVGGRQIALPPAGTIVAKGIARALNNRYMMGFARYRRGAASGPTDTVYLGAFRTEDLRQAGGWNKDFPTNQDFELNRRMSCHGMVWFDADLEVGYLPRETMGELLRQYRRFGMWKARYWRYSGDAPRPRQLAMLAAPPVAAGLWLTGLARTARGLRGFIGILPFGLLAAIDGLGAGSCEDDGPSVRAISSVASALVVSGWWSGAVQGLVCPNSTGLEPMPDRLSHRMQTNAAGEPAGSRTS